MSTRYLLYQLRRWAVLTVVPAFIVASLVFLVVSTQAKTYQGKATLFVQQASSGGANSGGGGANTIQQSTSLAQEYANIITAAVIQAPVDRVMHLRYKHYQLAAHSFKLSAAQQSNTPLLIVTVVDAHARPAVDGANAAASAIIQRVRQLQTSTFKAFLQGSQEQLKTAEGNVQRLQSQIKHYHGSSSGLGVLNSQLQLYQVTLNQLQSSAAASRAQQQSLLNSVTVYTSAALPLKAAGPSPSRDALLVALIILILCGAAVYLYDYLDDSLRTPESVEKVAGAPIIGTVPHFNARQLQGSMVTVKLPRSAMAEAYRVIRTNVGFTNLNKPTQAIAFTSPLESEGKTTTVANLARVFADSGVQVTIVDGDLRRPDLHRMFGVDNEGEGLTNLLLGETLNGHYAGPFPSDNLKVILTGPLPPTPSDLLGSERLGAVIHELQNSSSLVLLDTPPVLGMSDTLLISAVTRSVILVVDPSKSRLRHIRQAREGIEASGAAIVGVVINAGSSWGRYRYDGVRDYGYGSRS